MINIVSQLTLQMRALIALEIARLCLGRRYLFDRLLIYIIGSE